MIVWYITWVIYEEIEENKKIEIIEKLRKEKDIGKYVNYYISNLVKFYKLSGESDKIKKIKEIEVQ